MNDKQIDELIRKALQQEQEMPEGLSDRLEQHIDRLAAEEKRRTVSRVKKRSIYWLGGVAAALILGVAIFFRTEDTPVKPAVADTFSDPYEAAVAAGEVLAFLSIHFNQGLEQVSEARQEIEKVNEIVSKQLKDIHTQ